MTHKNIIMQYEIQGKTVYISLLPNSSANLLTSAKKIRTHIIDTAAVTTAITELTATIQSSVSYIAIAP